MTVATRPNYGAPIYIKTVASTAYADGDLLYDNGSNAILPASSQADQLSNAANARLFAPNFVGICGGKKLSTDAGTNPLPVILDEEVFFACASTTWEVGDLVGAIESSGGVALENQVVAKVTDTGAAIGVCTQRGTSATGVWFKPLSKLNRQSASVAPVLAGSTKTLTIQANAGQTILFDQLAGSVVTLPAAVGSGAKFRFQVSVLATSNSHKVQVANGTDVIQGLIFGTRIDSGNATLGFAAASTSDTITLNRTTTGSVSIGEWLEIEDYAAGFFRVTGFLSATGAAFATPFTAAVS